MVITDDLFWIRFFTSLTLLFNFFRSLNLFYLFLIKNGFVFNESTWITLIRKLTNILVYIVKRANQNFPPTVYNVTNYEAMKHKLGHGGADM